jgi:hypothetical protein
VNLSAIAASRSATNGRVSEPTIDAYSDSDWANDRDERKSTTGYILYLNGDPVSWQSRKQKVVALSTAEAEYYAITEAAKEVQWTKQLLIEILNDGTTDFKLDTTSTIIHSDSQSAIAIGNNNAGHGRSKHIDIRHHFIRDALLRNEFKLEYIPSADNPADMFTKGLGPIKFKNCRIKITGGC